MKEGEGPVVASEAYKSSNRKRATTFSSRRTKR